MHINLFDMHFTNNYLINKYLKLLQKTQIIFYNLLLSNYLKFFQVSCFNFFNSSNFTRHIILNVINIVNVRIAALIIIIVFFKGLNTLI